MINSARRRSIGRCSPDDGERGPDLANTASLPAVEHQYIPPTMNSASFLASSFLIGAARIVDVSGSISQMLKVEPLPLQESAARDWAALGADLRAAMSRYVQAQEAK